MIWKNMNKYIYSECTTDFWPTIKSIAAISYNNAVEKLITKYSTELDDEKIFQFDDYEKFREYLNDKYSIALSDLEIYEEL